MDTDNTYLALSVVLGGLRDNFIKDLIKERDYWKNKHEKNMSSLKKHNVADDECYKCNDLIIVDDYDNKYFKCYKCGYNFHDYCANDDFGNNNNNIICNICNKENCSHMLGVWCGVIRGGHYGCTAFIEKCPLHANATYNCPWKLKCDNCINHTIHVCNPCKEEILQDNPINS